MPRVQFDARSFDPPQRRQSNPQAVGAFLLYVIGHDMQTNEGQPLESAIWQRMMTARSDTLIAWGRMRRNRLNALDLRLRA
jgi:hypothetical protein